MNFQRQHNPPGLFIRQVLCGSFSHTIHHLQVIGEIPEKLRIPFLVTGTVRPMTRTTYRADASAFFVTLQLPRPVLTVTFALVTSPDSLHQNPPPRWRHSNHLRNGDAHRNCAVPNPGLTVFPQICTKRGLPAD